MKKWIVPLLALACAGICVLLSALTLMDAHREKDSYQQVVATLEEENKLLQAQVDQLTGKLEEELRNHAGGLLSWELEATAWPDRAGADVTLSGQVGIWHEMLQAQMYVELEGQEVFSAPCTWEDGHFTATAPLDAADGYSYWLILTLPAGTQERYALSTPNEPEREIPVFLASSLTTQASLLLDSWQALPEEIQVENLNALVLPPRLGAGNVPVEGARLVLVHSGTAIFTQDITLEPGEAAGSLQALLPQVLLPLPELSGEDYLELQLALTLEDGEQLCVPGIRWFLTEEGLDAVVG